MGNERAIEMFVGGLVLDPATQAPIVVLKDESGQLSLPIWIGIAEATSIASAIKQVAMARPLTHDLMYELLSELGVTIQRVVITELKESTYYAELVLAQGDRVIIQDARPSDAVAIALRASAPIYVTEQVLNQAKIAFASVGQNVPSTGSEEGEASEGEEQAQAEGEQGGDLVRDSAKDFATIDKDKWEEILSKLDADDFDHEV